MKLSKLLTLGCVLAVGAASHALTFNLGVAYTFPAPNGVAPFVTVTITDVAPNKVNIKVDHNSGSAVGQFVSEVYLNMTNIISPLSISNEVNANKRNGFSQPTSDGFNGGAGNSWDMELDFVTANSGGGVNRLKPGEFWSADFTGTGLSAGIFNAVNNQGRFAAAHIQGINGNNSSFISDMVVPEPASMTALAVGALALLRKRKAKKSS